MTIRGTFDELAAIAEPLAYVPSYAAIIRAADSRDLSAAQAAIFAALADDQTAPRMRDALEQWQKRAGLTQGTPNQARIAA